MGYGTREGTFGQDIQTYWPDDTDDTMYLDATNNTISLQEILEKSRVKWGQSIDAFQLRILCQQIQTDCIGYEPYDPMDHTDFIIIRKI